MLNVTSFFEKTYDSRAWYEKGCLRWLWVVISSHIAIFHIGSRKKEELLGLITEAFGGWLVMDGYLAYRSHEKRQRCLAHLIRKVIALTGAVDKKAQKMGEWLLRELRGLIKAVAEDGEGEGGQQCNLILARLKKVCKLGSEEEHEKLRAVAKEILNDWDAVVAFVKNSFLPPTNNEAERALRHAVIARRICFGTRTTEGSRAYAALLSVIETCRLRGQDPWSYIAETVALGRKGMAPSAQYVIVMVVAFFEHRKLSYIIRFLGLSVLNMNSSTSSRSKIVQGGNLDTRKVFASTAASHGLERSGTAVFLTREYLSFFVEGFRPSVILTRNSMISSDVTADTSLLPNAF
ncbi:IS66 family transposase [Desulfobacter sp.]|uniref:IS66 family transposase n=1 Tax=Desulfobacter sp. TaxID=2294 RepID=UPI003D0B8574